MHYYLYKITNLINNRIYIGVHQTKNLDDGYMGSGKIIRQAIAKYGLPNFKKEIIEFFDNKSSMLERESEIVNEDFLNEESTYNLKVGGTGGFDYINKHKLNQTTEKLSNGRKRMILWHQMNDTSGENNPFHGKKHTEETKQHISKKKREFYENGGKHPKGMLNKTHSEETKKHLSDKLKSNSSMMGKTGLDHPAGGTKWYNNGIKHLRSIIHPGEGWIEGRMFKGRKRVKND
jgi:group I intron endonuclease